MKLFEAIKKDHREINDLMKKVEKCLKSEDTDEALTLFQQINSELTIHAKAEEAGVYQPLKEKDVTKSFAYEGEEEHEIIENLMLKMDDLTEVDDRWKGLFTVLKEVVEHHVDEEESEMFAKMKKGFKEEELDRILAEFEGEKVNLRELDIGDLMEKPSKAKDKKLPGGERVRPH